jgi:uncharacterized protein (TIGR03437 family)
MFGLPILVLMGAALSSAQPVLTPQRIGGVPRSEWPVGDGGQAVNTLLSAGVMTFDRSGNLLVYDVRNQGIRRIAPDGAISTFVNEIAGVSDLAADSKGNLYLLRGKSILQISASGIRTEITPPSNIGPRTIAVDFLDNLFLVGGPVEAPLVWKRSPSGSVQNVASLAGLDARGPRATAFDWSGNLLIADWSGIMRLNSDGTLVRQVEGVAPSRIAPAPDGSVYMVGEHKIWRWTAARGVEHFAGAEKYQFSDGCAENAGKRSAKFASMSADDVVVDASGRVYVTDGLRAIGTPDWAPTSDRIRRIDPDGSIRTIAGTGGLPRASAPGGAALQANFSNPDSLAADRAGNVFFAESASHRVHEITLSGQFLTVAGKDSPPAGEDPACYSPAGKDVLSSPMGIALDPWGNLYISDTGNRRILRRTPDGGINTVATDIDRPASIAVKPDGSIYVVAAGRIRRIGADGSVGPVSVPGSVNWLAVDVGGKLIVGGGLIYREGANGTLYPVRVVTVGGPAGTSDPAGAIYTLAGSLERTSPNCGLTHLPFAANTVGARISALGSDPLGNLYVSAENLIWRIPAIAPPAADRPSPSVDTLGVFNAASNLTTLVYRSSPNPFHGLQPYLVNDSITGNEIVRIRGGCLGPLDPVTASLSSGRVPTSLAGTRVLFDGVAAPIISVQSTEILAIVPQHVAARTKATLVVENQGVGYGADLTAGEAAPGIFVDEQQAAVAINQDGIRNGPDHPASAGSIVSVFLTGAGAMDPPVEDGAVPTPPLSKVALPVTASISDAPAEVLYAGAVTGSPGVVQVNLRVPAVARPGMMRLKITVGGMSRNQSVAIAVQ